MSAAELLDPRPKALQASFQEDPKPDSGYGGSEGVAGEGLDEQAGRHNENYHPALKTTDDPLLPSMNADILFCAEDNHTENVWQRSSEQIDDDLRGLQREKP